MRSNIYAMYLRKSREDVEAEARGAEDTLKRHRLELVELANRQKINIREEDIYFEVITADTVADRPEMLRLLAAVGAGRYRGVLCMHVDRLSRGDTSDQGLVTQTFLAHSTLIVTPYRVYDPENDSDRDFFEMQLFMSRMEYRSIVRRMQTGRGTSTKEGKYAGSIRPFGYDRVPAPRGKGFTLRVREDEAAIVRLVFDWYVHGIDGCEASLGEIGRRLNAMSILTLRGRLWDSSAIRRVLTTDIYRGMVTWRKKRQVKLPNRITKNHPRVRNENPIVSQGLHEALVSQDLFDAAQRRLSGNRPISAHVGKPPACAFTGILICSECGCKLQAVPGWGSADPVGLRCRTPGCPTSGTRVDMLERTLLQVLRGWLVQYDGAPSARQTVDPALDACKTQVAALEDQLARIYAAYERGVYGDEEFMTRRSAHSVRLDEARVELSRLQADRFSPDEPIPIDPDRIRRVLDSYALAKTTSEKNQLLRSIISRIVYHKTHHCGHAKDPIRGNDPANHMTLDVYPNFD